MIARGHTRQSVLIGSSLLNDINGSLDDGVNLGVVLLHVLLREFEERPLRLLHQIVDVDGLVESLGLHKTGVGNQLTGKKLLRHHTGMILDISRGSHERRQFGDVSRSADILQIALFRQLFGDGPHIYGLFSQFQVADGLIDLLVAGFIEALGKEHFADHRIGVLINHECTEHGSFHLACLRLHMGVCIVSLLIGSTRSALSILFCHCFL